MLTKPFYVGVALLLAACARPSSTAHNNAFEGAWSMTEVRVTLRNGTVILDRQATFWVVSETYYSVLGTTGPQQSFYGNSGRYDMAGDTLTLHPLAGRDPDLVGGLQRLHVRARGDTLWLTGGTDDSYNGRMIPDTAASYRATEAMLVRLGN